MTSDIPDDKLKDLVKEIWQLWKKKNKKPEADPDQLKLFGPRLKPIQPPKKEKGKEPFGGPDQLRFKLFSPPADLSNQLKLYWLKFHEKYQGKPLTDAELKQEFSSSPFYQNPKKWRKDNFEGGKEYSDREIWVEDEPVIYKGPDLSGQGFEINGQKIKPLERVKYPLTFVRNLEGHMNLWNYALAEKLGLTS
jgi:hypothetical protein